MRLLGSELQPHYSLVLVAKGLGWRRLTEQFSSRWTIILKLDFYRHSHIV